MPEIDSRDVTPWVTFGRDDHRAGGSNPSNSGHEGGWIGSTEMGSCGTATDRIERPFDEGRKFGG